MRELSLREIFDRNLIYTHSRGLGGWEGIRFIENSPEELRDILIEAIERLEGTWKCLSGDQKLQDYFWSFFPNKPNDEHPLIYSTNFLRNNVDWMR